MKISGQAENFRTAQNSGPLSSLLRHHWLCCLHLLLPFIAT